MSATAEADQETSVAIVGAGPTGLTLANALGQAGIDVLLVERNSRTVEEPRAVSLDDEALRTMQSFGLVDEVISELSLDYGTEYYSPRRHQFARVRPVAAEYGYPRRSAFRQPLLEASLSRHLKNYSTVSVLFDTELVDVEQDADRVTMTLQDGTGRTRRVRARYLAACDGGSSAVRRILDVLMEGTSFEQRWLVVDTGNDDDLERETRVLADHRRPVISLPGPGDTRRWEFLLAHDEPSEAMAEPEKVRHFLDAYGVSSTVQVHRAAIYSFHARVASRWKVGRIFLLGDAAHLSPPYAGQGMNSGIRDAANLSWKLAGVVSNGWNPSVLDTYELERRSHAEAMINLALRIGRVMTPGNRWRGYGQATFFRAASIFPRFKSYFSEMKFKPKPYIRQGVIIPDGLGPNTSLVGKMLPQPRISSDTGKPFLLDDVLGKNFALVCLTGDPRNAFQAVDHPIWNELKAEFVCVVPRSLRPSRLLGSHVVRDSDGSLARYLGETYRDRTLVIRPDRYIAASFTNETANTVAEHFSRLLTTERGEDEGLPHGR